MRKIAVLSSISAINRVGEKQNNLKMPVLNVLNLFVYYVL